MISSVRLCEEGTLNLPEPANAMIRTRDSRVTPICHDWSERFPEAYNIEFQQWIKATQEGRVDLLDRMGRLYGTADRSRSLQGTRRTAPVDIHMPETPDFYKG